MAGMMLTQAASFLSTIALRDGDATRSTTWHYIHSNRKWGFTSSPGQLFGHAGVGTGDEGGGVRPRRVRLGRHGRHGQRPRSNSPQQREHKHSQEPSGEQIHII